MSDKILKLDQAQTLYQDLRGRIDALPTSGDIPEVPVQDVQVAGSSVVGNDGIANISASGYGTYGVVKLHTNVGNDGLKFQDGNLSIYPAFSSDMKQGRQVYRPITPLTQDSATFYGLAKVAGHDEASSTEPLGTYTPEAKGAIQQMLGVSDLIATPENDLVASKAYKVGEVFTANGKLYKATAAIAADGAIITDGANANCVETSVGEGFIKKTDYATGSAPGIIRIGGASGIKMLTSDWAVIDKAVSTEIKAASSNYKPIVPTSQHESVFYGLAKAAGADEKDSTLPVGQYTDTAKAAIKSMIGVNVDDVQVNGTSVVSEGVAEIPIADYSKLGLVSISADYGIKINATSGIIQVNYATPAMIKSPSNTAQSDYRPVTAGYVNAAAFYGLAKASGDTTQSASSNAVGAYTDNAKASIKSMLGIVDGSTGTVDVTGATPTINAVENTRYVCGEVTSLSFTPPASGISIVRFTSGSTVTVLTIPSTVKFPEWFDPTSLETNTIYEICVTDGIYGAVMSWAL